MKGLNKKEKPSLSKKFRKRILRRYIKAMALASGKID